MRLRSPVTHALLIAAAHGFLLLSFSAAVAGAGRVIWKPVDAAQLKLEGRAPQKWNVYLGEKKKNLVLVLLGHRYLALDRKAHAVYELAPQALTAAGANLESDEPQVIGRAIPTSHWTERDVGPAERVTVTLGDYGKTLELELPHPLNIRTSY